ncbi:MFS transporter [Pleomorphovibrio marinus]|uniref:MFS transporter n=1 Tax=Pleomorphovibrio marinus TaxID=2164132 RepID=UPI000E0BF153|nr:MFS transporter [Pleomorphovibrio marinus]
MRKPPKNHLTKSLMTDQFLQVLFGRWGCVATHNAGRILIVSQGILATATILISPLIADLATVFAISEAESGLLIGVFSAAILFTFPFSGLFADRFGARRTAIFGLTLFGLSGCTFAYVHTFEFALFLRIIQAIGFGLAQPSLIAMFADFFSGIRETTIQGINTSFKSIVQLATPVISGLLFALSWRAPFHLFLLALPAAALIWSTVPECESIDGRIGKTYLRGIAWFLTKRTTLCLMSGFFTRTYMLFGMYTYISVLAIRETGMTVAMLGLLLGTNSLMKFAAASQVGRLSGHSSTNLIAIIGFALFGTGLALAGFVPTVPIIYFAIAIAGVGDGLIDPAMKSMVNSLSSPAYRISSMAVALTFQAIGKTVSPISVGILLVFLEPATVFIVLGTVGGLLGVSVLFDIWIRTRERNGLKT